MTLQEAIKAALPFIGKSSPLRILDHILVSGGLVVAGDTTVEAEFVIDDDSFRLDAAIPARKLAGLIDILGEVAIHSDGKGSIIVQHGKSKYQIPTLPSLDYPRISIEGESIAIVTMSAEELAARLMTAAIVAPRDDVRHYLDGALVEWQGDELRIVASDGHRLCAWRVDSAEVIGKDFRAILPREALTKVAKALASGEITLKVFSGVVVIEKPGMRLAVKRIDGDYPAWRDIVKERPLAATVSADALIDAINHASWYVNEKFRGVRVEIGEGEIAIESIGEDGEAHVVVSAYVASKVTFGINIDYLLDAARMAKSANISISAADSQSSIRIEPHPRQEGYVHVVMPMRV